jgi:hypothetical protein
MPVTPVIACPTNRNTSWGKIPAGEEIPDHEPDHDRRAADIGQIRSG